MGIADEKEQLDKIAAIAAVLDVTNSKKSLNLDGDSPAMGIEDEKEQLDKIAAITAVLDDTVSKKSLNVDGERPAMGIEDEKEQLDKIAAIAAVLDVTNSKKPFNDSDNDNDDNNNQQNKLAKIAAIAAILEDDTNSKKSLNLDGERPAMGIEDEKEQLDKIAAISSILGDDTNSKKPLNHSYNNSNQLSKIAAIAAILEMDRSKYFIDDILRGLEYKLNRKNNTISTTNHLKNLHDDIIREFENINKLLANHSDATKLYYKEYMKELLRIFFTKYRNEQQMFSIDDPIYALSKSLNASIDDDVYRMKYKIHQLEIRKDKIKELADDFLSELRRNPRLDPKMRQMILEVRDTLSSIINILNDKEEINEISVNNPLRFTKYQEYNEA
jgi:hypothetical protein